ncbi:unnamed protein product [Penicillium salamii]|uniref:Carrier domain-containing protein n=1 Tax=Penicillium salamii TaxID=1612424 RepID=A0A9W4J0T0_9EURO|nr:unnamed protein product [Penicillium salamii]
MNFNNGGLSELPDCAMSEGKSSEPPIAITGMAMRLPGGVQTAEGFWNFLVEGKDGHGRVPSSRYNINAYQSQSRHHGVRAEGGYFLREDPGKFDPGFFDMRPRLAAGVDPQQRLLCEVVWECFENAGATNLAGKKVGCFVGVFGNDWQELALRDEQDFERPLVGCTHDFVLANQISQLFNLMGPSVTVRTACSSSMTALHEACQAIKSGECDSAIVAGTNLILTPTTSITMSDYGALSVSGMCKTFDAAADGYGRGEAVNAVFIKKLDVALEENDPVRAVIRATAINSDGRAPMAGVPRAEGQEQVIRSAYRKAGIDDLSQTGFFECHGTGTQKGDVIETSVVANLFKKGIHIGSVKPNVGHSEGASGLTSVIKGVLALEHQIIPPNIKYHNPNPRIPFETANLHVPTEATPWPENRAERVSINCFGVGGSNSHAILESANGLAKAASQVKIRQQPLQHRLLVFSAKSDQSLRDRQAQLRQYLEDYSDAEQDLAYTLGERREHLPNRGFFVTGESALSGSQTSSDVAFKSVTMVFSGQGAQWQGMGSELILTHDGFRNDIRQMDEVLQSLPDAPSWTIEDALTDESCPEMNDAEFSQPLCTALQIALVNLLTRWGVKTQSVAGHSSGEIAAAYAAGAIPMKTAIILGFYRGKVTTTQEKPGAMASVGLSKSEVLPYLENGAFVACENSPRNVTLSGVNEVLSRVLSRVSSDHPDALCKSLLVSVAYHSEHVQKAAREYSDLVGPYIEQNKTMTPMFSCITGEQISSPKELSAAYWRQTMESPVDFKRSITNLIQSSNETRVFIEVGPQPVLLSSIKQTSEGCSNHPTTTRVPTLLKGDNPISCLLRTAGELFIRHIKLDFSAINGHGRVLTNVPPYPWQHDKRYWYETRMARNWRTSQFAHHQLLGRLSPEASESEPFWRNRLQIKSIPWLLDHKIENDFVYPCVGYISMVGEAIRQLASTTSFSIKGLFMSTPMFLHENTTTEVMTTLRSVRLTDSAQSTWYEFVVSSHDGQQWSKHCTGQVQGGQDGRSRDVSPKIGSFARNVDSKAWYEMAQKRGLEFGPSFRRLKGITANPTGYIASATVAPTGQLLSSRGIDPVVIDQGFQLLGIAACNGISRRLSRLGIPISIDHIHIAGSENPETETTLQAKFPVGISGSLKTSMGGSAIASSGGELCFALEGVKFFPLRKMKKQTDIPLATRLDWKPDIDFLPAGDYLFKSTPDNSSMKLLTKLLIIASIEILDRIGISPSGVDSVTQHQNWATTNLGRLQEILQSYFPKYVNWSADPVSLQSILIKDVSAVVESGEPWVQPVRAYVTQILDSIGDQIPLSDMLMDGQGMRSLYEFATTNVDFGQMFALLGHLNPSIAVLELNPGTCGGISGALAALQSPEGVRLYSKYTVASQSLEVRTEAIDRFGETEGFSCVPLDPQTTIAAHDFETGSYDLIIIPSDLPSIYNITALLSDLRSLLVPGGRLLVREISLPAPFVDFMMSMFPVPLAVGSEQNPENSRQSESWTTEIIKTGFLPPELHSSNLHSYPRTPKQAIIAQVPHPQLEKENIYLLCPTQAHPWIESARKQLVSHGYNVHATTLENLPSGKGDLISLLDISHSSLGDLSQSTYEALFKIFSQGRRTLWVARSSQLKCDNPSFGLITGLARTIRMETLTQFGTFEIDDLNQPAASSLIQVYEKLCQQSSTRSWAPEWEFALIDGVVNVGRFHWLSLEQLSPPAPKDCTFSLAAGVSSTKSQLTWKEQPILDVMENEVEVDISYVGLNFRDIMVANGIIDGELGLGVEGSGVIRRVGTGVTHLKIGQRVSIMGTGLFATRVVLSSEECHPISDDMSLEDAATIPIAYRTAIYSLLTMGQLERGQSVLIHSACGAVGQAAIRIAQMMRATIYATVGTEQKAQYLQDVFGIPRENIFESRNASFVEDVKSATGGQGVDIVLNSLSEGLLHASWSCVAKFGKMIELGKRDFLGHGMLDMETFGANRSFIGVDLLQLALESTSRTRRLNELFTRLSQRGEIRPIQPVKIFNHAEIRESLAYMQRGTHIGKILIRMKNEAISPSIMESNPVNVVPLTSFNPDAAYLLVGGLGGIGRAVSNWLVEHGARHLVYLSRSGDSPSNQSFLEELRVQGCQPVIVTGSVSEIEDVGKAISESPKPIAGVINLGMVLKSAPIFESTYDDWMAVQDPKVKGSWNLHQAFSEAALDFFVVLSSITSICGSIGQASYASANAYLDALIRYRRTLGLPGATLNLGGVGDIGCFAEQDEWMAAANMWELRLLDEEEVIQSVEAAIRVSRAPCGLHDMTAAGQIITGMSTYRTTLDPASRIPWLDARYGTYANIGRLDNGAQQEQISDKLKRFIQQALQTPASLLERQGMDLLLEYIGLQMNEKAGTDAERAQVAVMALDSILLIEAVSNIRRNFGLDLTLVDLSSATTIGDLSRLILERLYEKMGPKQN